MKRLRLRWDVVAGAGALLLFLALALMRAQEGGSARTSTPSTFDYGPSGYSALYQMLRAEGVAVARFERSHLQLQGVSSALLIAQVPYGSLAGGGLARNDVIALKDWVLRGGRLIVLSPPYGDEGDTLLGIPASRSVAALQRAVPFARLPVSAGVHAVKGSFAADFRLDAAPKALPLLVTGQGMVAIEYRFGRGSVVAITDPSIFGNQRLSEDDNARFAFNLLAPSGVEFDEAIHGYTSGNSLWAALPAPARDAVYIAALILLLSLIGNIVRFAPPLQAPQADAPDSSAYLTAMARLLEHAGAAQRVLHDRAQFTLRAIRRAVGLSERTEMSALLEQIERAPIRSQLIELDHLQRVDNPSRAQLLRAGVLCAKLDKEFGV